MCTSFQCPLQEISLVPGEDSTLTVQYDSTYCLDKHTRIEERHLTVAYKEHPQKVHGDLCVWLRHRGSTGAVRMHPSLASGTGGTWEQYASFTSLRHRGNMGTVCVLH